MYNKREARIATVQPFSPFLSDDAIHDKTSNLVVITQKSDSMEPIIHLGDKIVIDRTQVTPDPGIFALWDALAIVAKRVEFIPISEPARIRVISDNEYYTSYERTADEVHIVGRVVGRWKRL